MRPHHLPVRLIADAPGLRQSFLLKYACDFCGLTYLQSFYKNFLKEFIGPETLPIGILSNLSLLSAILFRA